MSHHVGENNLKIATNLLFSNELRHRKMSHHLVTHFRPGVPPRQGELLCCRASVKSRQPSSGLCCRVRPSTSEVCSVEGAARRAGHADCVDVAY